MNAGQTPVLAMNAGMYHADMDPVGLYVEDGTELSGLNTDDGFGNFFLKPNGVFFIGMDGKAGLMESETYAEAGMMARFATQSGPMLVINGEIHPRFLPDGTTRYIRNGVGVREDGKNRSGDHPRRGEPWLLSRVCSEMSRIAPTHCSSMARSRAWPGAARWRSIRESLRGRW